MDGSRWAGVGEGKMKRRQEKRNQRRIPKIGILSTVEIRGGVELGTKCRCKGERKAVTGTESG